MARPPFPAGFFDRADPTPDAVFYGPDRFVTHIDDGAIAAVSDLYDQLEVGGHVLDLMSSWVSHLRRPPASLTVLGMNARELAANPQRCAAMGREARLQSQPWTYTARALRIAQLCDRLVGTGD